MPEDSRQAGNLLSVFFSDSLARLGALAGQRGDFIDSKQEAHEIEADFMERERFMFDIIDSHWS